MVEVVCGVTFFLSGHYKINTKTFIMNCKLLFSVVPLLLIGCNSKNENVTQTSQIPIEEEAPEVVSAIQPLQGIDGKIESFAFNAEKGDTLLLANGGSVLFPENCFVDADGNPIQGQVDIEWQEFHTLGDIIASGIPMKYDSLGISGDLVSGGMFTINGYSDGEEVFMSSNKKAEVNLVSLEDTPCYNFYALDEKTGDWQYKTTKSGRTVKAPEEEKQAYTRGIFDVQVDLKKFKDLNEKEILGWRSLRGMDKADQVHFLPSSSQVRLEKSEDDSAYVMVIKNDEKIDKYIVEPYTVEMAVEDSKVNSKKLDQSLAEVKAYEQRVAEGKVVRTISIDGFGTYNWDIINKRENSLPILANFAYPTKVQKRFVNLFLVSPEENAVVAYDAISDAKFSFDPEKKNCIIAILPDNSVLSVSNQGFNAARKLKPNASHTFKLKESGVKLKSPEDIMNHIQSLI